MKDFSLKYGINPHQDNSRIYMEDGSELPIKILNGKPSYINLLDAFNSYQLVKEIKEATNLPAATSFKHVSPTSAAVGLPLSQELKRACFLENDSFIDNSKMAMAYARARGTDRLSSFGDFIALSGTCDEETAMLIKREVSDGIIAPSYTEKALEILKSKRKGTYNIIEINKAYEPSLEEKRQVYGVTFTSRRNDIKITEKMLENIVTDNKKFPEEAKIDLLIALITLKYTQSNSVAYAYKGQTIGVGAGQQSRIHCTRLAGNKADTWFLRQSPKVLNLPFHKDLPRPIKDNCIDSYINNYEEDVSMEGNWQKYFESRPEPFTAEEKKEYLKTIKGVSLGSDAFFPFPDNILRASKSGVSYIAQPGGSIRDEEIIRCCNDLDITMCFTKNRLFHH